MGTIQNDDQSIKTEHDYDLALEKTESLFGVPMGSEASDCLEVLVTLVQGYEVKNHSIGPPSDDAAAEYEAAKRGTGVDAHADALRAMTNDVARCLQCQGTGRCLSCKGTGNAGKTFYSSAGDCDHCLGYGWCQHCRGSAEDPSGTPAAETLPVDTPADTLRDGLLAVGATEASLLAALRERRENTESIQCHECGGLMVRDIRPQTFSYQGQSETVDMPGWYCQTCNESIHSGADITVWGQAINRMKALAEI